jgi:hypothetical protein
MVESEEADNDVRQGSRWDFEVGRLEGDSFTRVGVWREVTLAGRLSVYMKQKKPGEDQEIEVR